MSKSKKPAPGKTAEGGANLNLFGNFEAMMKHNEIDLNDPSLEAELNELMDGDNDDDAMEQPARRRPAAREAPSHAQPGTSGGHSSADSRVVSANADTRPKQPVPSINLPDISALVHDVGDIDVDENDPALLAELQGLETGSPVKSGSASPRPPASPQQGRAAGGQSDVVQLLNERISMYREAIDEAKARNESSKQSRYERQLGTLTSQLKQAERGKPVDAAAIPPPVFVRSTVLQAPADSSQPTSSVSASQSVPALVDIAAPRPASASANSQKLSGQQLVLNFVNQSPAPAAEQRNSNTPADLTARRDSYRQAALAARNAGDLESAKVFVAACKQLDVAISTASAGGTVAEASLPPADPSSLQSQRASTSTSTNEAAAAPPDETDMLIRNANALIQQAAAAGGGAADSEPQTLLEALELRLERHSTTRQRALDEGNESRAGRLTRICSQYSDAIRTCKKTGTVQPSVVSTLPDVPGLPPLANYLNKPAAPSISSSVSSPSIATVGATSAPAAAPVSVAAPAPVLASMKTPQMKIIDVLEKKRDELKASALKAKQSGQTEVAKDYLRAIHRLQPLIDAAQAGLPVDSRAVKEALGKLLDVTGAAASQPGGPGQWEVVDTSGQTREEVYQTLIGDLQRQIGVCQHHVRYFEQLGRVNDANKFKADLKTCEQDLRTMQNAMQHGDPVPKFHYETRVFSATKCCPDLRDSDLSIEILRGINYRVPDGYQNKDFQTYILAEFPLSSESTHSFRVSTATGGVEHVYNHVERVQINRKSAAFQRIVKTKQIKCEVWAKKKSILGKDILIGIANVRLNGLESDCDYHSSFDLVDEKKKPSGGMLEVRLRIRTPLIDQKTVEQRERWLVIEQFIRSPIAPVPVPVSAAPAAAARISVKQQPAAPIGRTKL